MLTIHHLAISQSDRVIWLCEELGIAYDLRRYDREPGSGKAPAALRALHPAGLAPVICDGTIVLAESGAIVEYIVALHGAGRLSVGPDAPEYPDYLFWFHFANATFQPSALVDFVVQQTGCGDDPKLVALGQRLQNCYTLVEDRLGNAPFFAGDIFTAADIMMVFNLTTLRLLVPFALDSYPNITRYLARIGSRPAYRRAMELAAPSPAAVSA